MFDPVNPSEDSFNNETLTSSELSTNKEPTEETINESQSQFLDPRSISISKVLKTEKLYRRKNWLALAGVCAAIFCSLLTAITSNPFITQVYSTIITFSANHRDIVLPASLQWMNKGIRFYKTELGQKLLFINDIYTDKNSASFSFGSGYFTEKSLKRSVGVANLAMDAVLENDITVAYNMIHRNGELQPFSTTFTFETKNKIDDLKFALNHFQDMIKNFSPKQITRKNIKMEDYKFYLLGEKDIEKMEFMQRKLTANKFHPFSNPHIGNFKTLDHDDLGKEVDGFIKESYTNDRFSGVVVSNYGDNKKKLGGLKSYNSKIETLKDIFKKGFYKSTKKPKDKFGLPFQGLPRLVCVKSEEIDLLEMTYQVKSNIDEEKKYETSKYVSFLLDEMLRKKLQDIRLAYSSSVKTEYFKDFTLIKIRAEISTKGKSKVFDLIATILAAVREIKAKSCFRLYAEVSRQLLSIFNTKTYPNGRNFAHHLSKRILLFGYSDSLRAGETLNNYDSDATQLILDQLDFDNLLISILGDFFHVQGATSADLGYQKFDLKKALSTRITKLVDYSPINMNNPEKEGSISLDQYLAELNEYYHEQQLTRNDIDLLKKASQGIAIPLHRYNPYKLSSDFAKSCNKHFDTKNLIESPKYGDMKTLSEDFLIFYRKNDIYSVPQSFLSLRFMFRKEDMNLLPHKERYHVWSLLVEYVWRRRLGMIAGYAKQYNGEVKIHFEANSLKLTLYGPSPMFPKLVKDVSDAISFRINPVDQDELETAYESVYRRLMMPERPGRLASIYFDDVWTEETFVNIKLALFLNYDRKDFINLRINPELVMTYYEGTESETQAKRLIQDFRNEYQMKEGGYKFKPLSNPAKDGDLWIIRKEDQVRREKTYHYVTGFNFGEQTIENLTVAQMVARFFLYEMREELIIRTSIANQVDITVEKVSGNVVLKFLIVGLELPKIELAVEKFLISGYLKMQNLPETVLDKLENLSVLLFERDYDKLNDFGEEDDEDLFLSHGEHHSTRYNANRKASESNINRAGFVRIVKKVMDKPKRFIFEYGPTATKDSVLNEKVTFQGYKVKIHVVPS